MTLSMPVAPTNSHRERRVGAKSAAIMYAAASSGAPAMRSNATNDARTHAG